MCGMGLVGAECAYWVETHPVSGNHKCRRDANPQYNGIYANLEQCQDACAKTVPQCNVVNYAGQDTTDRACVCCLTSDCSLIEVCMMY